ncbi:uncharacterized protein BYT42DRAFT_556500 [Radiomyces spectabilis]|uniref:uncharacterized protein n=1 Tax=Radiomyces spectabilis TaxID=64574 RepID=UPI00221E4FE5|nr:uncharacterized protein BYT42DRAFT_556500 [Radiomyces spectabilis]KAI8391325.1 hypothetical protein BYT42DRAFT_556500 [Radiomyces spectabilis]
MQDLEVNLESYGYIYSRKLTEEDRHSFRSDVTFKDVTEPLCHYYDILLDDSSAVDDPHLGASLSYEQFFEVVTSAPNPLLGCHLRRSSLIPVTERRRFVKNDERRQNLIYEFIRTEISYANNLKSFISLIVHPIRTRTKDKHQTILGLYECNKIFMNIEEILQVSEAFCKDLCRYRDAAGQGINFGDLCLKHLKQFRCYHKYLLGVENAQAFNIKELKHNASYQAFLDKTKDKHGPDMGNQTVYDYLALPGQRVGRYTMFFKELIKHTTDDHIDLPGLTGSLAEAEEIANMSEDYHTKLIRIFHNMLQSIQNCPASLLSQQRSLICHLDATELDALTYKPISPVTLFLFTDKLMVVRRPTYAADGMELCGLDHERDKSGMVSLLVRKSESNRRIDRKLKFKGWVSLNDIEIHDGHTDLAASFTLVYNGSGALSSPDVDPQTRDVLEGYFQDDWLRLFSLSSPATEGNAYIRKNQSTLMHERQAFLERFGRAKANHRQQNDMALHSSYCFWKGHHFFANIYRLSNYHLIPNKNDIALCYMEQPSVDVKSILSKCYITPHMIALLFAQSSGIYQFSIRSKLSVGCVTDMPSPTLEMSAETEADIQHFRDQFFGNLLACDNTLRHVGRLAILASPHHRQGTKTVRQTIRRELTSRRSMSSFKLFTGLGNSSATTPNHNLQASNSSQRRPRRPRSMSISSEYGSLALDTELSRNYSSSCSSFQSQDSDSKSAPSTRNRTADDDDEDRLASSVSVRQHSQLRKSSSQRQYLDDLHGMYSKRHEASCYRPSVHPSQTVSYEIKPLRNKLTSESDRLEERVNVLCAALTHGIDHPGPLQPTSSYSSISTSLFRSPSGASNSGSTTDYSSGFSTFGSRSSTSTFNSHCDTPFNYELFTNMTEIPFDKKVNQLLAQVKATTPDSFLQSSMPFEKLISEMDQMKKEFNRRWADMNLNYEETGEVVRKLARELQKKEEDLANLHMKYQDAMAENDLLYEAFNGELDQIFSIVDQQPSETSEEVEDGRPAHPTPEAQIRKKLESALKERNQWHQIACKLARELQELSVALRFPLDNTIIPDDAFKRPSRGKVL